MEPLCKLFSPLVDLKVGTLGEDDGLLLLILIGGLLDTQSVLCCLIFHLSVSFSSVIWYDNNTVKAPKTYSFIYNTWHKDGFMNKSISPSSVPVRWGGIMSQNSSFKRISQCCADNNESLAALQTSFTLLLETYRTFVDTQKQSYFRNRVTWPPPDANSLWIRPRPCPPFFMTHIQSFSPALYYCRLFILRYKAL